MKRRLSISLEEDLLKQIDYLLENKYDGLASRSSLIERYLREPKSIVEDFVKFHQEKAVTRIL